MLRKVAVNLGNLLLSISDAMDLATPRLMRHQQRVAFAAWEMSEAAGFSVQKIERGFIAAILHDVGAFSQEEKKAVLELESGDDDPHVLYSARLLADVVCLNDAAPIVRHHHRKWTNRNAGIAGPFVLEAQILALTDPLERRIDRNRFILHQHESIFGEIQTLSGTTFHPDVVGLLMQVSAREEFWFDLVSPWLYSLLLTEGPYRKIETDPAGIVQITELFRNMIDFKSRFPATHSSGVAAAASLLARKFGLTETEVGLIEVAGNLHDLGKVVISNNVLDNPGPLLKEEMAIMKAHTYFQTS